jgi:hypothetical protein
MAVFKVSGNIWIEANLAVGERDLFKLERGIPSHPSLKEEKVYAFLRFA